MKKKILSTGIILCLILILLLLTGCGKTEYTENMKELRNSTIGYLGDKTLGELIDIAVPNAEWTENEKYSMTSGAIIIKGKDRVTKADVEIVWLTNPETTESGYEKMKLDNSEISYSEFLDYLKNHAENKIEVKKQESSNNKDSDEKIEKKADNVLICKDSTKVNHMTQNVTYTFTYNNELNKIQTINQKFEEVWDTDYWEDRMGPSEVNNKKAKYDRIYNNIDGIKYNVEYNENVVTTTLDYTITDENRENLKKDAFFDDISDIVDDYNKLKEHYENKNYKCQ